MELHDAIESMLYAKVESLKASLKRADHDGNGIPIWREGSNTGEELVRELRELLRSAEDDLIDHQREEIDSIQLQEQRVELFAESHMMGISQEDMWGNYDSLGNTRYQEQLYHECIDRSVRYEDGYDDPYGKCPTCGRFTDEWRELPSEPYGCCNECFGDGVGFVFLLCLITNHYVQEYHNRWHELESVIIQTFEHKALEDEENLRYA